MVKMRTKKTGSKKLVFVLLKALGIIVCILVTVILIAESALLYCENHDFSDQNGLDKKEFSCHRGDLKIRGTVFMPSGQTDVPIAIICHEFMTNRLFSYPYAMALARSGYAAFCFDFCGGGIVCGSDGDSRDMSVLTEVEDLKSVIAFAKEQRYTSDELLLLMGCSQGGLVAALTAAEMPEGVSGLILQYPALCIPDAARKGEMLWLKFDPAHIPEKMHAGPMRLGRRYAADVMDMDAFQNITGYTGKVLLLHGDRDTIVDMEYSKRAFAVYQAAGADARFVTIPGGKHIFRRSAHIRQAQKTIAGFAENIKEDNYEIDNSLV